MKLFEILIGMLLLQAACTLEQLPKSTTISNDTASIANVSEEIVEDYAFVKSIPVPEGFQRISVEPNSYGDFLRNLPLKQGDNIVLLYDGTPKNYQGAQFAIVDIDVGTRDLQQCADAVMRLRGEYLFAQKQFTNIHFNFLSDGKARHFTSYAKGDYSYKKFRKYMNYIFAYANTASLKREMTPVTDLQQMQIGDVFIQQGRPYGHAITVMDMAENEKGEKIFLLSQSYMPAQDIHILNNLTNTQLSPWYRMPFDTELRTPEWTFNKQDLKRF